MAFKTEGSRSEATLKRNYGRYSKPFIMTIQKQQKKDYVDRQMIDEVMEYFKSKFVTMRTAEHGYEIGNKYCQLHLHTIVSVMEQFYFKYNNSYNGFRIEWTPIYNFRGAINYVHKDTKNNKAIQDQIFNKNEYQHPRAGYGFI